MNRIKLSTVNADSILSNLNDNDASMVIGATGSGKSSRVPLMLAERGWKVLVSLPTREAVRNLYSYVSNFTKNIKIGYSEGGRRGYDNDTQLIYATSGHVRNRLFNQLDDDGRLKQNNIFSKKMVIILDEVHTGSVDNTIIMSLWKIFIEDGSDVKIILMTATERKSAISDILIPSSAVTNISTSTSHKVYVKTADMILGVVEQKNVNYKILFKRILESVIIERVNSSTIGHVLGFVPSIENADTTRDNIKKFLSGRNDKRKMMVISLHSKSSMEDINLAVRGDGNPDTIRVIIATNAAESAITIENVSIVVDTMRVKVPRMGLRGNLELAERLISLQSSEQRKGRTGRTIQGTYIPCMDATEYKEWSIHAPVDQSEIMTVNIEKEVLNFYAHHLRPEDWISELKKNRDQSKLSNESSRIDIADVSLMRVEAIVNDIFNVTNYGKFSISCPLELRQSKFLWLWLEKYPTDVYWGSVISCLISNDGQNFIDANGAGFNLDGPDSLSTIINIWIALEVSTDGDALKKIDVDYMKSWCSSRGLRYHPMIATVEKLVQVINICARMRGIDLSKVGIETSSTADLMQKVVEIFQRVYGDLSLVYKPKVKAKSTFFAPYIGKDGTRFSIANNGIPTAKIEDGEDIIPLLEMTSVINAKFRNNRVTLWCYKHFSRERYLRGPTYKAPERKIIREEIYRVGAVEIEDDGIEDFVIGLRKKEFFPMVSQPPGTTRESIFSFRDLYPPSFMTREFLLDRAIVNRIYLDINPLEHNPLFVSPVDELKLREDEQPILSKVVEQYDSVIEINESYEDEDDEEEEEEEPRVINSHMMRHYFAGGLLELVDGLDDEY